MLLQVLTGDLEGQRVTVYNTTDNSKVPGRKNQGTGGQGKSLSPVSEMIFGEIRKQMKLCVIIIFKN